MDKDQKKTDDALNLIRQIAEVAGWVAMTMHCDCHIEIGNDGTFAVDCYADDDRE